MFGCAEGTFPEADESDVTTQTPTLPASDAATKKTSTANSADDTSDKVDSADTTEEGTDDTGSTTPGDAGSAKPADSGSTTTTTAVAQGDLVISEVMYDPSGTEPDTEWLEIYNTTSSAKSLNGLILKDGASRTHTIAKSPAIDVQPGAYVVLARDKSAAIGEMIPSNVIVYEYGAGVSSGQGVSLTNSSTGAIYLLSGSTQIARADYAGWFSSASGASIQLKTPTYSASASASNWCLSTKTWASGSDKGSPGAAANCP